MEKHYLYRHIRKDKDEPFYIGIGTRNKDDLLYYTHSRAATYSDRNSMWNNTVKKTKYDIEILYNSDDYEFIKQKEIEFIALYGRKNLKTGPLCNLTNGGEGVWGMRHSLESRKKMSETRQGRKLSAESQAKRIKTLKEKYAKCPPICTEEQKQRLRTYQLGRKHSQETINKRIAATTGQKRIFSEKGLKGLKESTSRKVINVITGNVYASVKEAAFSIGIKRTTLSAKLGGQNSNNTSLMYLDIYNK